MKLFLQAAQRVLQWHHSKNNLRHVLVSLYRYIVLSAFCFCVAPLSWKNIVWFHWVDGWTVTKKIIIINKYWVQCIWFTLVYHLQYNRSLSSVITWIKADIIHRLYYYNLAVTEYITSECIAVACFVKVLLHSQYKLPHSSQYKSFQMRQTFTLYLK